MRKNAGARKNIGSLGEVATHTYPCPPHLRPCHLHRHCPASSLLPQGGEGRKNISSFAIFKTLLQQWAVAAPASLALSERPQLTSRCIGEPGLQWLTPGEHNGQHLKRLCAKERVFLVYLAQQVFSTSFFTGLLQIPRQWVSHGPGWTCRATWWRVRKLHPTEGSGRLATGTRPGFKKQTCFLPPQSSLSQQVNNSPRPVFGPSRASAPCLSFHPEGCSSKASAFHRRSAFYPHGTETWLSHFLSRLSNLCTLQGCHLNS